MDHPDEPFFPRSDFAFASPGVPQKEQRVRYTYTGLELPSPFGGRSPLCSKRDGPFEKGGPHYVASPMPGDNRTPARAKQDSDGSFQCDRVQSGSRESRYVSVRRVRLRAADTLHPGARQGRGDALTYYAVSTAALVVLHYHLGLLGSFHDREVMLHQYTEVSPMSKDRPQVKKLFLPAPKQNINEMRYAY